MSRGLGDVYKRQGPVKRLMLSMRVVANRLTYLGHIPSMPIIGERV